MTQKRYALIFPGQGSQSLGMMAEFRGDAIVENTFTEASDTLGIDMWGVVNDARLNDTKFTQPALLTASIAIWRRLCQHLPTPFAMAGHSLGEYSALCAGGVIEFKDAVMLVHERGKLMQEAVLGIDTKMAAVLGLSDEQVTELCMHASKTAKVDAANFNSPGQVVIAGTKAGVEMVMQDVKSLGKKCVPLNVSVPSHCSLMLEAAKKLQTLLIDTKFYPSSVNVVQNLEATAYHSPEQIKSALMRQFSEPVQWAKTMDKFAAKNIEFMIECGFGNVLSNLAKRQATPITSYSSDKPEKIKTILELL